MTVKYEFHSSFQLLPNIMFVPEDKAWLVTLPFYGTFVFEKH